MASDLEKIGLEALLLLTNWSKNVDQYLGDVQAMEKETESTAKATAKATEEQARKQEAALSKVGLAFTAVGAAGTALLTSIALTASRTEELGVILDVTATNARRLAEAEGDQARAAELSGTAVKNQVQAVKELGITTQVASQLVAQLIRFNLDWQRSTELAALAQDAATFAAQDSSEALAGLIHGITTLNPRVLRQYGILVNLEQEYAQFADETGRAVNSITSMEKQQIALNAVLNQAPAIAGAYEAAMSTASKQIRSLSRDTTEVAEAFGESLLPALSFAVGGLREFLKWLRDLPAPLQATVSQMGLLSTIAATLGGTFLTLRPKILEAYAALSKFAAAQNLTVAGLLGPAGLIAAIAAAAAALVFYANNLEKAHREEAAGLITTSETYDEYIRAVHEAGLETYALSESLYDLTKATDDVAASFDALELQEARQDIKLLVEDAVQFASTMDLTKTNIEGVTDRLGDNIQKLNEAELAVLANREEIIAWGNAQGLAAETVIALADAVGELVSQERIRRDFMRGAEDPVEMWQEIAEETKAATDAQASYNDVLQAGTTREAKYIEKMIERRLARQALTQAEKEFEDVGAGAVEAASEKMVDAEEKADDAREKAREDLIDNQAKLEEDHADRVADLLGEIADVDQDLKADLLDAEKEFQQQRIELEQEYAQEVEALERDLAEKQADLLLDLQREQEDAQRDFNQRQEDLRLDLDRDLEDLVRDHKDTLLDIEQDYYSDLENLTKKSEKKIASITERYNERVADIEERYNQDRDDIQEKYFQQVIKRLEGRYTEEYIRKAWEQGWNIGADDLRDQLEKELELLDEGHEEELERLKQAKEKELAEEKEALEREQKEREAAYEKERARAEEEYNRKRQDREKEYNQDLDDLKQAKAREQEERQRDFDRRQQDLQTQHERERAEIERRNRERLAELEQRLAEERTRLEQQAQESKERLQEQLADESASYAERRQELQDHYDQQKQEIEDSLAEEQEQIKQGLAEELAQTIESLGEQSQAFRDAHAEQLRDLDQYLGDRLERERQYQEEYKKLYGISSPSRWSKDAAKDIKAGFDIGFGGSMFGGLEDALLGFQSNIGSLAAPQYPTIAPPAMNQITTSIDQSRTTQLNYTGQQYSEPSLRALLTMSEMASGRR